MDASNGEPLLLNPFKINSNEYKCSLISSNSIIMSMRVQISVDSEDW